MGIATYPSKLGRTAKQPSARQAQSALRRCCSSIHRSCAMHCPLS